MVVLARSESARFYYYKDDGLRTIMKTQRIIKNRIINKLKEHNIIEKEKALDILIEKLNSVEGSEFVFNGKYTEFH